MAASFASTTSSTSSTFISPETETLTLANNPSNSTDSSQQSQTPVNSSPSDSPPISEENEESEEEECGFCLFMKGGGCRESFIAWEKCVEEAEKKEENVVNKCMDVTSLLKKCMDEHADYYEPILRAEKEMENAVSEAEGDKEIVSKVDT